MGLIIYLFIGWMWSIVCLKLLKKYSPDSFDFHFTIGSSYEPDWFTKSFFIFIMTIFWILLVPLIIFCIFTKYVLRKLGI